MERERRVRKYTNGKKDTHISSLSAIFNMSIFHHFLDQLSLQLPATAGSLSRDIVFNERLTSFRKIKK